MTSWNLAEDLQSAPTRAPTAYFVPPIAGAIDATTPFKLASDPPAASAYSFGETYVDSETDPNPRNHRTTEVTFSIRIAPGTYPTDPRFPSLPAGAIRLHALSWGKLTFTPATSTLSLEMTVFSMQSLKAVPWWQRWVHAQRIPKILHYDNVDVDTLRALLQSIPGDQPGIHGLFYPQAAGGGPVTDRTAYVNSFLQGTSGFFFGAKAGAVIGAAGARVGGQPGETEVRLRARYSDHTDQVPYPMSPRELFYLAFGEAGPFSQHPLFTRLNQETTLRKRADNTLICMAGMKMRPPLRTWRRLIWEAEQENAIDEPLRQNNPPSPHWGSNSGGQNPTVSCSLGGDSLLDKKFRRRNSNGVSGNIRYGDLDGVVKCNVFTTDHSVRAGFKALIHEIRVGQGRAWHYHDAASHANIAREAIAGSADLGEVAVRINGVDAAGRSVEYGWARTRVLTSAADNAADRAAARKKLNDLMMVEGRPMIVAGTRRRKATGTDNQGHVNQCAAGTFIAQSGHIVFLEEVTDFQLIANVDVQAPGLTAQTRAIDSIDEETAQAQSTSHRQPMTPARAGGARVHFNYRMERQGVAQVAGDGLAFIRIHLLEPAPGGDPDLLQGLQELHLQRNNITHLRTSLDRARPVHVNGAQCCIDNWPQAPTPGNC